MIFFPLYKKSIKFFFWVKYSHHKNLVSELKFYNFIKENIIIFNFGKYNKSKYMLKEV